MNSEFWNKQYMLVWVFDVGRGNCGFVRTPSQHGILLDCGGENSVISMIKKYLLPRCREQKWVAKNGNEKRTRIGQVIISHPHVDHFRNIAEVIGLDPILLTCPHDKQASYFEPNECVDWELIQNPEGSEELLELYRSSYEGRNLPLQVFSPTSQVPHLTYGIFYIRPPECEPVDSWYGDEDSGLPKKDYGNNISIMTYFRFNKNSIFFPGDIMASGMKHALKVGCENRLVGDGIAAKFAKRSGSPEMLRKWINSGCSILVAPHHGLESGYSREFFLSLPVDDPRVCAVLISEKAKSSKDEGNVHSYYQNSKKVKGISVIREDGTRVNKLSITTRTDGNCLIGFRGSKDISVVVSKNLEWILTDGPNFLFT
jgi:beta-lactamase superfamily II metal-dependent hydrolase